MKIVQNEFRVKEKVLLQVKQFLKRKKKEIVREENLPCHQHFFE